MAGNDSDLGRFRLWNRKEMTILAPVRVGIGIVFSSCWQNLSENRLELNWYDWNSELSWCMIPIPHINVL